MSPLAAVASIVGGNDDMIATDASPAWQLALRLL
jgi:hypothetical protein